MTNKYLVSVFVDGKHVNSYYSENLDDLVTIKAIHRDCEISIFDTYACERFSEEQVMRELNHSRLRWKKSLEMSEECEIAEPETIEEEVIDVKPKEPWMRRVMCMETGQFYASIKECAEHTGIPYMTIINSTKHGNATRGLHFVNV